MPDEKPRIIQKGNKGGLVVTQHTHRHMRSFHVLDDELDTLSTLGWQATLFYSLFGSFTAAAFGLWSGIYIEGSPSDKAKALIPFLIGGLVLVALLFLILGIITSYSKNSKVANIRSQSADV